MKKVILAVVMAVVLVVGMVGTALANPTAWDFDGDSARGVNAFGKDSCFPIQNIVKDGNAQIGHADLIGIRVGEDKAGLNRIPIFFNAVPFTSGIATRAGNAAQNTVRQIHFCFHDKPEYYSCEL